MNPIANPVSVASCAVPQDVQRMPDGPNCIQYDNIDVTDANLIFRENGMMTTVKKMVMV